MLRLILWEVVLIEKYDHECQRNFPKQKFWLAGRLANKASLETVPPSASRRPSSGALVLENDLARPSQAEKWARFRKAQFVAKTPLTALKKPFLTAKATKNAKKI
jgi:hypothetical protein